jgi:FTR1 family protein
MLPTFVIGLREGLEAALIVGIVAAFLVQEGRRDALRPMWAGVAVAVLISVAVGAGLQLADNQLPQREQEGLETVIAVIAVGFVTWMILWMRRNARGLKGELHGVAAGALAKNSGWALIAMAFFAVIREGFETAFFLTAAFNASEDPGTAGAGAALGVALAAALGYAIYRGGARIDLQKFFKATGVVLVFVAAGLVASALHTGHEAGWVNIGQDEALDLSWLVVPGTVTASLLTGMLGLQPKPVQIEVMGYLLYALPLFAVVLWPAGRPVTRRSGLTAAGSVISALLLFVGIGACGSSDHKDTGAGGDGTTAASSATTAKPGGATTVAVQIGDEGCLPATLQLKAGPTTFKVTASGSGKATEYEIVKGDRILGERENLTPGLSATFSLDLEPGEYESYCPGADRERGKVTVTGEASSTAAGASTGAAELQAATVGYASYVEGQAEILLDRTKAFVAAVKAGDVEEAKALFPMTRQPWERIEPVAESFGDLDPRVDARVNDVAEGDEWTGFHRIEQALWKHDTTKGMGKFADQLLADVKELVAKVEGLKYQPAQLANGATELLGEVSKSKITGEEDRYSHTDLYDFEANVDGAHEAFELLEPALSRRDPALLKTIDARFEAVRDGLDKHRKGDGFVSYTALSKAEVRALSQQIDALAEPLSRVAATVVTR